MSNFDCNKFCERAIALFGDVGQMELSQKIGISQGVISAIKNKKSKAPGADTIYKIATYFNVTSDYLLGLNDSCYSDSTDCVKCSEFVNFQLQEQRINFAVKLEEMAAMIRRSKL